MKARRARRFAGAVAAGLVLCWPGAATAARFSVNPTRVLLSAKNTSALLTLCNQSDAPLRLQVTVFSWDQAAEGEMMLADTEDVLCFPGMLVLAPGEERRIRVAVIAPPADREKSYRVFIDELPRPEEPGKPGVLRVLTRLGVPVFMAPAVAAVRPIVKDFWWEAGRIGFTVENAGSVHFVPDELIVRAIGPDGRPIGERKVEAWYILAAGIRRFSLDLSDLPPENLTAVAVELRVGSITVNGRLNVASPPP